MLVKDNENVVFDKHFINLSGNYLFGRSRQKCLTYLENFSKPAQIIAIPETPNFISNYHAVICCLEDCCIIDGWGDYYSRNGIYVNSNKITFKKLENKDVIHLGHQNYQIIYYEKETEQIEKETDSKVFKIRELPALDDMHNNIFNNIDDNFTSPL